VVNLNDQPRLGQMLEEVCSIYSKPYSDVLCHAYYRVLKPQSFEAVSRAVMRVLSDEGRRQIMPTAAEIKAIARHMEQSGELQTYLPCQGVGCKAEVAFPPQGPVSEESYYCPRHKPLHQPEWDAEKEYANRVTPEEKRAIFERATPKAKAFLRSIDVMARQMTDIPITAEEQAEADADAIPLRARAFEDKSEGPGVEPSLFLNRPALAFDGPSDAGERRQIIAAAGWKYVTAEGVWRRGRYDAAAQKWRYGPRAITEDQIDRCLDLTAVAEFARRR
jgi:hypothetical protein